MFKIFLDTPATRDICDRACLWAGYILFGVLGYVFYLEGWL